MVTLWRFNENRVARLPSVRFVRLIRNSGPRLSYLSFTISIRDMALVPTRSKILMVTKQQNQWNLRQAKLSCRATFGHGP
jgi:hypothetical protein